MVDLNKLNELYNLAYQKGYDVINYDLTKLRQKGMVLKIDNETLILIDEKNIETTAERKTIIAHEVGHAETNALYNFTSSKKEVNKCEYKAVKWAVKELIPFAEYFKALKSGIIEVWQLAEYFNVTEDFIRKTHYIYEIQGLV